MFSTRKPSRVIHDPALAGDWNMSIDQALLEGCATNEQIVFRTYRWTPATISLGYFQPSSARDSHVASRDCPLVRRSTGGGAIVHDHEITYSLIIPTQSRGTGGHLEVYRLVHRSIIHALSALGIVDCTVVEQTHKPSNQAPFLCFLRRSEGDVLLRKHKIVGSAQRRGPGTLLQHGSILLKASRQAPELPGVCDLADREVDEVSFLKLWIPLVASTLGTELVPSRISVKEQNQAARIKSDRYANSQWTNRR